MKLNETSMRVGRLSRKLLSIDENFDLEEDKQCPRNISSWFCTISTRILSWKSKIQPKFQWNTMGPWEGGGLLPKSPPFDENFDLEGDKVCSREILPSSDTIETVTMPNYSKTHTYIWGYPSLNAAQSKPAKHMIQYDTIVPQWRSGLLQHYKIDSIWWSYGDWSVCVVKISGYLWPSAAHQRNWFFLLNESIYGVLF